MKEIKKAIIAANDNPSLATCSAAAKTLAPFTPEDAKDRLQYFRQTAKLFAIVANKIEIEKKKDVPRGTFNVIPPIEAGFGASGMSPEAIKNPILRKKYEQEIAENEKYLRFWNEVAELKTLKTELAARLGLQGSHIFGYDDKSIEAFKKELIDQDVPAKAISKAVAELKVWKR